MRRNISFDRRFAPRRKETAWDSAASATDERFRTIIQRQPLASGPRINDTRRFGLVRSCWEEAQLITTTITTRITFCAQADRAAPPW
jgi:hypothetical protein